MESNQIPPSLPEPQVRPARNAGAREEGSRRQLEERRRKAFRQARQEASGDSPIEVLQLSETAHVEDPKLSREPEVKDDKEVSLEVRGRRLDIRI